MSNQLKKTYANFPDEKIISLAQNASGLKPEARQALQQEVEKRQLSVTINDVDVSFGARTNDVPIGGTIQRLAAENKPTYDGALKVFKAGSQLRIKGILVACLGGMAFAAGLFVGQVGMLIGAALIIFLGVYLFVNAKSLIQLVVYQDRVLFYPKTGGRKGSLQDLSAVMGSEDFKSLPFSEVTAVETSSNVLDVNPLYLVTAEKRIPVLFVGGSQQLEEVVSILKRQINTARND